MKSDSSRRYRRGKEAIEKTIEYLSKNPDASGRDVARFLDVSETQGKYYKRIALTKCSLQGRKADYT